MKPYLKNGKIIYNKKQPPTEREWREIILRKYIQDDIQFYSDIKSVLNGSEYADNISYANERISQLAAARYELMQNQPPELVANLLGVHYNELLHEYI